MNIFQFIEGHRDGNSWQELCDQCYHMKYQGEHYTTIPAIQGGDGGIEGFTQNGIVNQCYHPERDYSDNELYNHLRDKMTDDINKLCSDKYAERLTKFGVPPIKEWHFVIPEYKDSRIIAHAEAKRKEVVDGKIAKPNKYAHIADNFKIVIKTAIDFTPEITRIVRTNLTDKKLNLIIQQPSTPDWSKCDSEKAANIRRKIKAVMHKKDDDDPDVNEITNTYIKFYIKGIEIMDNLRLHVPEVYEEIFQLERSYKNEVAIRTKTIPDNSMNYSVFTGILDEFQSKLEKDFSSALTQASIGELKQDLVASWMADCSMEFRG